MHTGHWQLQPAELTISISKMTEEEKELVMQCGQINFSSYASANLINVWNVFGLSFDNEQIRYLNKKEQDKVRGLTEDGSTADNLIESFKRRDDVAFLTVTYSPTEGLMLSMTNKQRSSLNNDLYFKWQQYDEVKSRLATDL